MKIVFIILVLVVVSCAPKESYFRTCNIKFMNNYLDKCQDHCLYEDDGYNCKYICAAVAEKKYCN